VTPDRRDPANADARASFQRLLDAEMAKALAVSALHARIALAEELLAEGQPWQADSHRPRHENCVMCGNDWPCHTRQVADFLAPVEVSS
jgi:hypothetical protein